MSSTLRESERATDELGWLKVFSKDLPAYGHACLQVQRKDPPSLVAFDFNRAQMILHRKVSEQRRRTGRVRVIVLKARQLGISTYVAARFFRVIHLWRQVRAMVIADESGRSTKLFDIYDRFGDQLPSDEFLRPVRQVDQRGKEMRFGNGSELLVETAGDVKAGRAVTIHRLHISEYAFWEHPVQTMTSLMESVPHSGSEVFIESTANGVGNDFHQLWREAEAGENEWLPVFLPWFIDPDYRLALEAEERDEIVSTADGWERRAMAEGLEWEGERWRLEPEQLAWRRWKIRNSAGGERAFRQENPATASEAFLVSGAAFFDQDALVRLAEQATAPTTRGTIRIDWETKGEQRKPKGVALQRSEGGWLRIWDMPEVRGHYVIGADTAEGRQVAARATSLDDAERGGRDFDSADVIRLGYWSGEGATRAYVRPKIVAQLHARMAPETLAEQLYGLGTLYSCPTGRKNLRERALLGVERNHRSGVSTIRRLRELGYERLYVSRPVAARKERPQERIGWLTTGESRRPMLDQLGEAVRLDDGLQILSAETIDEMLTFVFDEDGKPQAQEGTHDDRVISASITLEMTHQHAHAVPEPEGQEHDYLPERPDTATGY